MQRVTVCAGLILAVALLAPITANAQVGACCRQDGSCDQATQSSCVANGGTWYGAGVPCAGDHDHNGTDDLCEGYVFACCFDDGSCINTSPEICIQMGGMYSLGIQCQGDADQSGADDWCEGLAPYGQKWLQAPDLSVNGADVAASRALGIDPPPYAPIVLATDFECTHPGLLIDLTIYGSWYQDVYPAGNAENVSFNVAIYDDIPDPDGAGPEFSRPGQVLWSQNYISTEFVFEHAYGLEEGWLEPPDTYTPYPLGDETVFEYRFHNVAFTQEGTPTNPKVYWVAIQANIWDQVPAGKFGWKTARPPHWNDDAVWAEGVLDGETPLTWGELVWPANHPAYAGQSIDLAIEITGVDFEPTGACCYPHGACAMVAEADCLGAGGTYHGDWTECEGDVDPVNGVDDLCEEGPFGACCMGNGDCQLSDQAYCAWANGTWMGAGTDCLGDNNGNFMDDACDLLPQSKFWQQPDLWATSIDIDLTTPIVLADDFVCVRTGPIDTVQIWASWYNDIITDAGDVTFQIAFYEDIPDPDGAGPEFSKPGALLCMQEFQPGSFTHFEVNRPGLEGGWYNPDQGTYEFPGDHNMYSYIFEVDEPCWYQYGTMNNPIIYWIAVYGSIVQGGSERVGWKTSFEHFNDNAVYALYETPQSWHSEWSPMVYPDGHPLEGAAIDMAFSVFGPHDPPATGACCYPDGNCATLTVAGCLNTNGVYSGDGTACEGDTNPANGTDDACEDDPVGCCTGILGDANGDGSYEPSIGDVSIMIDAKFITGDCGLGLDPPAEMILCYYEADVNQSATGVPTCDDITIGDISLLIDYLFITGPSLMDLPFCD